MLYVDTFSRVNFEEIKTFISLPCLRQEHAEVSNFKRTSWIFWKTESLLLGLKKPVQRHGYGKLKSTDVSSFAVLKVVQPNPWANKILQPTPQPTLGSFSGSRINTDRFPHKRRIRKLLGRDRGHAPP